MTTSTNLPPTSEKLALLGTITSGLVHEVRNPLNAIKANLQLMEEDMIREENGEGPHTRRVRRLLGEVARLDNILSDFLLFVREDTPRFVRADLSSVIEEVATLLTPQADSQGATILRDIPENIFAEVDPEAIKQALMNLALNALQAMDAPGTLMFRLREDDGAAVIDVIDTGRGIPKESLNRIFEHFFSTRPGGTGIGLSVVAKIVESHNGAIKCESEVGRGTSFKIVLPMKRTANG